ncbi:MAG: hypothetical protein P4L22_03055 [Candidatus Babeliales bacterium]|nr:hypothetical protein [Candidatus Babeliales bacterium]
MSTKFITKLNYWLLETLKLQLFLNLISFIILIHWGMPISLMSPIGNIFFAPFITIFLVLSSLVFFCEILTISNIWLTYCLEIFTKFWLKLLSFNYESWKITFAKPHFIISSLVIILAVLALKHKKIQSTFTRVICLIFIFIFLLIYTKLSTWGNSFEVLMHRNKQILIICNNNKVTLQDKGVLERASWYWIQYDLVSHLIKKFGHCNVDELILNSINKENKNQVKLLSKRCNIKNVIEKDTLYL